MLGLRVLGAVGVAAALAVAASARYVRSAAAGHLYREGDVPSAPVALVLGAQVYPGGAPSRFLAGRLDLALRLYRVGLVRVIVVSGDGQAREGDEPAVMRRHLVDAGVPAEAIITDPYGFDTYDSCVRAQRVYGVEKMIIVSQSYHLPRAVGTARLLGLDAVGVGDRSVQWVDDGGRRRPSEPWLRGAVRDVIACVKTVADLATGRLPVLGPADDAVRRALDRPSTVRPTAPRA